MPAERVQRRLTTILSADAVGFSRLMAADEMGTLRLLSEARQLLGDTIAQHGGRVVDAPGDNLLAEFPSVVDAVQYAVEIQKGLARRNAALPEERRMPFRIGLNLGDVVVDGERIYGDGVNVTARLEGRGEVAQGIYERIRAANPDMIVPRLQLAVMYESLGRDDEARLLVQESLRVNPELTAEVVVEARNAALLDAEERAELRDALRRAGLP